MEGEIVEEQKEELRTVEEQDKDSTTTEVQQKESLTVEEQQTNSMKNEEQRREYMTMEERKKKILELLNGMVPTIIILVGDTGMGKTWMAREISKCVSSESLCYETLWVSLIEKHHNDEAIARHLEKHHIYEAIARQLSIITPIIEEWEDDEINNEEEDLNQEQDPEESLLKKMERLTESLKQKIELKIVEKRDELHGKNSKKKYLLLVLDDEANKMNENELREIVQELRTILVPSGSDSNLLKILITRRKTEETSITEHNSIVPFEPLSVEESLPLFRKTVGENVYNSIPAFEQYGKTIAEKSTGLPSAIIAIADALKYVSKHVSEDLTLEAALKKAAGYEKAANHDEAAKHVNPLFYCAYDMLMLLLPSSPAMKKCFWHSIQFFRNKSGGVHFNELITHWIMEGYFDSIDHIEKAYQKAHSVLMQLMDRGMLKKTQEDNYVIVEGAALNMIDPHRQGFGGTSSLGLVSVFGSKSEGLGRMTWREGMIKTLCDPKHWEKVSSLLIDGVRLSRQLPHEIQVLAVFNGTLKSLIPYLLTKEELRVLVLRSCVLLAEDTKRIMETKILNKLTVLEISGASSLEMAEKLFDEMTNLQSLNLSGLQIEKLPSVSSLSELRFLILRGCSRLKTLPSLEKLGKLETLDLSGASTFENFPNQSLNIFPKLQMIDLSDTKVKRLPKFHDLNDLTRVLLRGCKNVETLPTLDKLPSLQILDLSGAVKFKTFQTLPKSEPGKFPPILSNLSELNLSGCHELKELPSTTALKNLEVLDISNARKLEKFRDSSFQHLTYLRSLKLSNTKVTTLPEMEGLTRLEELDLSGCSVLRVPETESFTHMRSHIKKLNLDGCGAAISSEIVAEPEAPIESTTPMAN